MPFIANTPESLLARTDSKKPDATCRGITSSGRPCRRPITARPPRFNNLAVPDDAPSDDSLYCWQHKDQASHASSHSSPRRVSEQAIPEQRSSLDTLADRLGLVDLNAEHGANGGKDNAAAAGEKRHNKSRRTRRPKEKKKSTTLRFCFCFSIPEGEDDDDATPPRPHRPRPQPRPAQRHDSDNQQQQQQQQQQHLKPSHSSAKPTASNTATTATTSTTATTAARLKRFIPDSLAAPAASALMTELARPLADSDEPGYIYMFWLTPVSASAPVPVDAARSLLAAPPSAAPHSSRGASDDAVSNFAAEAAGGSGSGGNSKTMLLKIGRAANVQRRMNQWSRQCGYSIQMLRYYPYIPSSSSLDPAATGSSTTPRMTSHCKKVERLVHLELSGMGLRAKLGTCEACGREHREWFEVEATREGIRSVDEVIRRWVEWDRL